MRNLAKSYFQITQGHAIGWGMLKRVGIRLYP
jgi:hypothetical protein